MFNRKGFTLVELMIVVAIIGILASIAIPNFVSMQYKTKRSEIPSNLKAIKTAQIAYESDFDTYVTCAAYPSSPTKTTQQWDVAASAGFKTIGWRPDGDVRGSYAVTLAGTTNFTATGLSDVDGDLLCNIRCYKVENANSPTTAADVY